MLSEEDAGRFGVEIVRFRVEDLLESAASLEAEAVGPVAARLTEFDAIHRIDPGELDRSARLGAALTGLGRDLDALAVRCWPECFTEFGAAACAPIGLMNDALVPTTCEADGFGCLTGLVLGAISDQPSASVDLVAPDFDDDTAVVWHCGQLPPSMSADGVSATLHSNRGVGVLGEFRLRPGAVTLARISAARGEYSLVVGRVTVLDRPRPFSGTSGVIRFDRPVTAVVDTVLGLGLDHHFGLVYGDHRAVLAEVADQLRLPLVWL